jgi:hypothetical protein
MILFVEQMAALEGAAIGSQSTTGEDAAASVLSADGCER